jgi:hypothetical protein
MCRRSRAAAAQVLHRLDRVDRVERFGLGVGDLAAVSLSVVW